MIQMVLMIIGMEMKMDKAIRMYVNSDMDDGCGWEYRSERYMSIYCLYLLWDIPLQCSCCPALLLSPVYTRKYSEVFNSRRYSLVVT